MQRGRRWFILWSVIGVWGLVVLLLFTLSGISSGRTRPPGSSSAGDTGSRVPSASSAESQGSHGSAAGSAELPEGPASIGRLKALLKRLPPDPLSGRPLVMLSTTNEGFLDFTMNLICSYRRASVDLRRVLVVAFDRPAYDFLELHGVPVWLYNTSISKVAEVYDTEAYRKVTHAKTQVVHAVLSLGVDVFYVDGDIAVLRDPLVSELFVPFSKTEIDLQLQCDFHFRDGPSVDEGCRPHDGHWINSGFYIARSSPQTLDFFKEVMERELRDTGTSEQLHAAAILTHRWNDNLVAWYNPKTTGEFDRLKPLNGEETKENRVLRLRYLDAALVPNGSVFFKHKDAWKAAMARRGFGADALPYMLHANWMLRDAKKPSLEQAGCWYYDEKAQRCL